MGGGSGNSGRRGTVGEDRPSWGLRLADPNPAEAESARETNAFWAIVEDWSELLPRIRGGTESVA